MAIACVARDVARVDMCGSEDDFKVVIAVNVTNEGGTDSAPVCLGMGEEDFFVDGVICVEVYAVRIEGSAGISENKDVEVPVKIEVSNSYVSILWKSRWWGDGLEHTDVVLRGVGSTGNADLIDSVAANEFWLFIPQYVSCK